MRKKIALLLTIIVVFTLAACGDKPVTADNNDLSSSQNEEISQAGTDTADLDGNEADVSEPDVSEPENKVASVDPDEDGVLVSWGGVLKYNPEKWEKTALGLEAKDAEAKIVFMPYGYTVDEMMQNIEDSAEDITVEDITVNGNSAKKVIYTSLWSPNNTTMSIVIDTSFIGSSFSTVFEIEMGVEKGSSAESLIDDAEVWDMINSFYYDEALLS